MSFETCAIRVKKWMDENAKSESGRKIKLPDFYLEGLARLLDADQSNSITQAQFHELAQHTVENYLARTSLKMRTEKAMDMAKVASDTSKVMTNAETWEKLHPKTTPHDQAPYQSLVAHIEGGATKSGGVGTNISSQMMSNALEADYLNTLHRSLGEDREIFMAMDKGSNLAKDVYEAKWSIENKIAIRPDLDPQALRIAKAVNATQNRFLIDRQSVSPFVERAKDYMFERNHNADLITADPSSEGQAKWIASMVRNFGKRSLLGLTQEEKINFFQEMYKNISAGTYDTPYEANNFFAPSDAQEHAARQMAPMRQLQANDWHSEWEYARDYGDSPYQAMTKQAFKAADNVTRIGKWGSDAPGNFENLFKSVVAQSDEGQRAYLMKNKENLLNTFKVSLGSQYEAPIGIVARFMQNALQAQVATKTGNHLPRALTNVQNIVSLYQEAFGGNALVNTPDVITEYMKGISPLVNASERAKDLGVYLRTAAQDELRNAGIIDQPGKLGQLAEAVGTVSGANKSNSTAKYAAATLFMKQFGEYSDTAWKDLPNETKTFLGRYNLLENEWDHIVRKGTETLPYGDETRPVITMEGMREKGDVEAYLRATGKYAGKAPPPERLVNNARVMTALNYGTMINEICKLSALESDVRQRNLAYGNTTINDGRGQFWRAITQFRMNALVQSDLVARSFYSGTNTKASISAVAQKVVLGGIYAALGGAIIRAAQMKTPINPIGVEGLTEAIVGSGGAQIWGDTILRAATQGGSRSDMMLHALEGAAGPLAGTAADIGFTGVQVGRAAYRQSQGNSASYPSDHMVDLVRQNLIPGTNIFYLKSAADYLFMNQLHEVLGKGGYLDTQKKNTAKHEGLDGQPQGYFVDPGNIWRQ